MTRAMVGAVVWLVYACVMVPNLHDGAWAHALLLLAALVLVPLALDLVADDDDKLRVSGGTTSVASGPVANENHWPARLTGWTRLAQLPCALLLAGSCTVSAGGLAALAAAPWVGVCGLIAITGCLRATREGAQRALDALCGDIAMIFLGVGGAWVFADRAGFQPLNFSPAIVELTAVHFHFAGLLLPLFAGLTVRSFPDSRFAARAAVGVVLGVPAVAVGITTTQLGWGPAIECAAGCGLALAGMAVAILHLRLAIQSTSSAVERGLFLIAGTSLFFGMLLAGFYALRAFTLPLPWLDLPWMRALHGTANALGFGLCGTLAWRRSRLAPRQ